MNKLTIEDESIFEDDEYGNKILEIVNKINEIIDTINED